MLTVVSIPKPYDGETGRQQRCALASWAALGAKVFLVGDDYGVGEAAEQFGASHIKGVARNSRGTPFLDAAFRSVEEAAPDGIWCFVNADIVLNHDLLGAVGAVRREERFLLVGQSRDLEIAESHLADPAALRRHALQNGRLRGPTAIDWFVFPPAVFYDMPGFLVGRAAFDNWMIWKARKRGPVIDATEAVIAIHQPHDYAHLAGGKNEAYYGSEAEYNRVLAGGSRHIYTLHDATHRMSADLTIHRNLGSILRWRETARKVGWKLGVR